MARYKLHFDVYDIKKLLDAVVALMAMGTILTGFGAC
jgi:hypothetical protein